jgi:ElaB/YqjD/DUF883 family membrane-anchored ribosome-binding protein
MKKKDEMKNISQQINHFLQDEKYKKNYKEKEQGTQKSERKLQQKKKHLQNLQLNMKKKITDERFTTDSLMSICPSCMCKKTPI